MNSFPGLHEWDGKQWRKVDVDAKHRQEMKMARVHVFIGMIVLFFVAILLVSMGVGLFFAWKFA